jgi:phosphate transport system substrate-binding protein
MVRVFLAGILLLSGLMLALSACNSSVPTLKANAPSSQNPEKVDVLKGTITVSGAFALYPMMVKWAEEFQKIHPDVKIDISAGGAGKGAADALAGLADIGMVSREIYQAEIDQGGFYVAVTKDAVVATANGDNPFKKEILSRGIKKEDFINIWIDGKVTQWNEIFPVSETTDVAEIHVYTRSDACGAGSTWADYLGKQQEDLLGVGVYGDPGLAEAVTKDRLGIGYNNLGYAYDAATKLQIPGLLVIPIDINGNGKVDAEEDFYGTSGDITNAIMNGAYPSPPSRELNLLTLKQFTGITREFVIWILTDGQQYVSETGYIQLSPERLAAEIAKIK